MQKEITLFFLYLSTYLFIYPLHFYLFIFIYMFVYLFLFYLYLFIYLLFRITAQWDKELLFYSKNV